MVDKVNDYINYYKNVKAQELYFDQSGSPVDPKRSILKNSRKIVAKNTTPITPTPNSLVSETPRGKKCTAEEESNQ